MDHYDLSILYSKGVEGVEDMSFNTEKKIDEESG